LAQGDHGATQLIQRAFKDQKIRELNIQKRIESVDGKKNQNLSTGTEEVEEI